MPTPNWVARLLCIMGSYTQHFQKGVSGSRSPPLSICLFIASKWASSSPLLCPTLGKVPLFYTFLRFLHSLCPPHLCSAGGTFLQCDWTGREPSFYSGVENCCCLFRLAFPYFPSFIDDLHTSSLCLKQPLHSFSL